MKPQEICNAYDVSLKDVAKTVVFMDRAVVAEFGGYDENVSATDLAIYAEDNGEVEFEDEEVMMEIAMYVLDEMPENARAK